MTTQNLFRRYLVWIASLASLFFAQSTLADTTPQTLPFIQDWSITTLITTDDDWSGVPGIVGYRGDGLAGNLADPQTVVVDGSSTPVDVNANETNPDSFTTGGAAEFDTLADPTVALAGSGTADAPHLVIHLDTTGETDIVVSYNVRDLDGSSDDAVQQVALQYRVGSSGNFTNLPEGYVADATSANAANQVTPISVMLPVDAENEGEVQVRILTANASGADEWVGIDDISVSSGGTGQGLARRLLLTEVVISPTNGEFIEIHNPNAFAVDLSDYYLTDATFTGSPSTFYYNLPTGVNAGGGDFGDFFARFPDGAMIGAGETQTVALAGSTNFFGEFGLNPTYELFEDDVPLGFGVGDGVPEMREALPGSINGQGGLSNSGEVTVLLYWDGASDLVVDIDYVLWGDQAEAVDKTGAMIDGPDADGDASAYAADVATASQDLISNSAHGIGESYTRIDASEGNEAQSGSNGIGGASETSEDLSNTWTVASTPTPGTFGSTGGGGLEIFDIQGSGATSPFVGMSVTTEDNIVIGVVGNGFYIQTPDARSDGNDATSDGLFVFTSSAPTVSVGDQVDITGSVTEFFDFTQFDDNGLSVTVDSSGNALPTAVTLDATTPDPGPSDPPDLERFEGMLVRLENFFAVSGSNNFGDVPVAAVAGHQFRSPGIEFPGLPGLPIWDGNQEVFEINPDGAGLPDVDINYGDEILLAEGPLAFSFGDYQVQPTTLTVGPMSDVLGSVRTRNVGEMTLSSLNVFRLFDDVDDPPTMNGQGETRNDEVNTTLEYTTHRTKLARYILDVLDAPDVLAIQEVESLSVMTALATEINGLDGSVSYTAVLQEGNDVGTIDVGYLYRSDITLGAVTQLGLNETFLFDGNTDLTHDRPPLLLEATYDGNGVPFPFAALVLHNRSLSRIDDPTDGPRVRQKRLEQAQSIAQMVQDFQTANPAVPLVVLGDFNAFEFTDGYVDLTGQIAGSIVPGDNLLSGPDLVDPNLVIETFTVAAEDRYSFNFGGTAQVLDHALTSMSASPFVRGMEFGKGNSDASSTFFSDPSTPLRASDHDGLVLFLMTDQDADSVPDDVDNCPMDFNPGQEDSNNNGIGDACDSDDFLFFDGFESGDVSAWSASAP